MERQNGLAKSYSEYFATQVNGLEDEIRWIVNRVKPARGNPRSCILHGQPGLGKSAVGYFVFDLLDIPYEIVEFSEMDLPYDHLEMPELKAVKQENGEIAVETVTKLQPFLKAFAGKDSSRAIVGNEILEMPRTLQKQIGGALAERKIKGHEANPDFCVIGTQNPGVVEKPGRVEKSLYTRFDHYDFKNINEVTGSNTDKTIPIGTIIHLLKIDKEHQDYWVEKAGIKLIERGIVLSEDKVDFVEKSGDKWYYNDGEEYTKREGETLKEYQALTSEDYTPVFLDNNVVEETRKAITPNTDQILEEVFEFGIEIEKYFDNVKEYVTTGSLKNENEQNNNLSKTGRQASSYTIEPQQRLLESALSDYEAYIKRRTPKEEAKKTVANTLIDNLAPGSWADQQLNGGAMTVRTALETIAKSVNLLESGSTAGTPQRRS